MRTTRFVMVVATIALASWAMQTQTHAQDFGRDSQGTRAKAISANLKPTNEVPAVSSPAEGHFSAEIDADAGQITYELTFSGLQAPVTQSHIHVAQPNVNGAIVVWLCGTATNPGPAGTQTCPQSGTITGVITGANIQNVPSQGFAAGEFEELIDAIRGGFAYANVHTSQSPGGEIRGQIRDGRGHDHE